MVAHMFILLIHVRDSRRYFRFFLKRECADKADCSEAKIIHAKFDNLTLDLSYSKNLQKTG